MGVGAMSFSDSLPVFRNRANKAGLSESDVIALEAAGVDSLAKVAFISNYAPGAASDDALMDALKDALQVHTPSLGQKASFRRLFHEAYALAATEMKALVEKTDDVSVRRLSQPERAERYERVSQKLKGLVLKGRNEPSDSLVDFCVAQYDDNRLKYVAWERCTFKDQELTTEVKRDTSVLPGGLGDGKAQG